MPLLDGITVLDLSTVGPAARASRWLADYGATVVKVGPVPSRGDVQITPPFYAYSAHREMRRAPHRAGWAVGQPPARHQESHGESSACSWLPRGRSNFQTM